MRLEQTAQYGSLFIGSVMLLLAVLLSDFSMLL